MNTDKEIKKWQKSIKVGARKMFVDEDVSIRDEDEIIYSAFAYQKLNDVQRNKGFWDVLTFEQSDLSKSLSS